MWDSGVLMTFPLWDWFYPRSFPPRALPRFNGTMTYLTSWQSSRFPRFYTCPSILSLLKELSGPPTFTYPLLLHAMLSDPEDAMYICPFAIYMILPSGFSTPSAIPQTVLTGLNHFSPKAYGLQYSCLRLTHGVTDVSSRLGTGCVGSTLSWWLFQPLAE
jgi:hypothetical protein